MFLSARFRLWLVVAASLCAVSLLFGQQKQAANLTISGTVVNSVTGEPIRGALVQIVSGTPDAVLTDGDGRFQFDNLSSPQLSVVAHKPGFLNDEESTFGGERAQVVYQTGTDAIPMTVKLTPEGVISGHVQDESGQAIEDLPVKLIYVHVVEGRKRWEQRGMVNTDQDGAFRFADLNPGTYFVKAGPSSVAPLGSYRDDAYAAQFYPGTPGLDGATPLRVGAGEKAEADFSLRSGPVFKVGGAVAGLSEGQGIGLEVTDEAGDVVPTPYESAAPGHFQLRVPAGSYVIRAWIQGSDGVQKTAEQLVRVQANVNNLRMVPVAMPSIPVVIRTEFSPASSRDSGEFRFGRPFQAATVHLVPQGSSLGNGDVFAGTRYVAGQAPELALQNVRPGKYLLAVNPNGNWYVQSARWGDVDALREELNVPAGGSLPPIEIVLRDDGGMLSGTIQSNGAPVRGQVLLVPDRNRSQVRTDMVGNTGHFDFGNLPPDGYSVVALDHADGLQYADPGALDSYLGNAVHVTVAPNARQSVNVNLTRVER